MSWGDESSRVPKTVWVQPNGFLSVTLPRTSYIINNSSYAHFPFPPSSYPSSSSTWDRRQPVGSPSRPRSQRTISQDTVRLYRNELVTYTGQDLPVLEPVHRKISTPSGVSSTNVLLSGRSIDQEGYSPSTYRVETHMVTKGRVLLSFRFRNDTRCSGIGKPEV